MALMHVEVVSAEKQLLSVDVKGLYARSLEGEIGILPGHQPALIALDIAPVKVEFEDGHTELVAVHNGFLFVGTDRVIVLADTAELASEIDTARAQSRVSELEAKLADGEDVAVRTSLTKHRIRLDVAAQA